MKKIIKLTESDLIRIIERVIQEGKTDKGMKEKDSDVKIDRFQETIKNFLKSNDCKVKQVGDDFEIHYDGDYIGQVMFRKNGITVKKEGSKFGKDFDYSELGKVKSEIKKLMKKIVKLTESDLTNIVKRVINESVMGNFIESMVPELNKLNKRTNWSRRSYGHNEIFYNKETKDYIFRYVYSHRKTKWDPITDEMSYVTDPNILWIKKGIYDEIKSYIPSDEMILQWFNERYKKDAKELKTHYTLKEK